MKILLLGGTGAMGGPLSTILARDASHEVVVTSRRKLSSRQKNLSYVCGNAREDDFLDDVLACHYDVVVDFMNYGYDEFTNRYRKLLASTGQYVFLSSARVYAESRVPLTEDSARLLATTSDADFLATQRYALRKARQEDLLLCSGCNNFTIVRPYKTFSEERLQLGAYEKEQWLQGALHGKRIPLRRGMLEKKTTLTYEQDVSCALSRLIGNDKALGEVLQIASPTSIKWSEVFDIYRSILAQERGVELDFFEYDVCNELDSQFEGGYQIKYDVLWDRTFDSAKINRVVGQIEYTDVRKDLKECLLSCLRRQKPFLSSCEEIMRIFDKMEKTNKSVPIIGCIERQQ